MNWKSSSTAPSEMMKNYKAENMDQVINNWLFMLMRVRGLRNVCIKYETKGYIGLMCFTFCGTFVAFFFF